MDHILQPFNFERLPVETFRNCRWKFHVKDLLATFSPMLMITRVVIFHENISNIFSRRYFHENMKISWKHWKISSPAHAKASEIAKNDGLRTEGWRFLKTTHLFLQNVENVKILESFNFPFFFPCASQGVRKQYQARLTKHFFLKKHWFF